MGCDETNKVEKSPLASKQKQKQKSFAETGQMVVNIKSKPKIKSAKKTRDKEAWCSFTANLILIKKK